MTDEFDLFNNDSKKWTYNPYINTPNADRIIQIGLLQFLAVIIIL